MRISKLLPLIAIGLGVVAGSAIGSEPAFRFLAVGDLSYSPEEEVLYQRFLEQSKCEDFAFLMHVGDTKAQLEPCSDAAYKRICGHFEAYPKSVAYTPGDNEWTDCHHSGGDQIESLGRVRELFFHDENVLRLGQLGAQHQSDDPRFARYIENYRFTKSGVLFVMVHVCGSSNNRHPDYPVLMQEFTERNAANLAFLKECFAEAMSKESLAVVIAFHANPFFENRQVEGFVDTIAAIEEFVSQFPRPVVCIHGDTHYYRVDKPFKDDAGRQIHLHFTRMEVFGAPNVAGVAVTVDPEDPLVFSFKPYYLSTAIGE